MHLEGRAPPRENEVAIQSDAYIDALLNGHARQPIRLPRAAESLEPSVRHVIRMLDRSLPRFHPSFLFEERLAAQLRVAADELSSDATGALDRRLLMGGALASGVSIGAAAMLAWRRRQG